MPKIELIIAIIIIALIAFLGVIAVSENILKDQCYEQRISVELTSYGKNAIL